MTERLDLDLGRPAAEWAVIEDDKRGLLVVRYRKWPGSAAVAAAQRDTDPAGNGAPANRESGMPGGPHARKHGAAEEEDDYPHVVLRLGEDWRIVGCREDLQWIAQRRVGSGWRTSGYCHTTAGVQAVLRRNGLDPGYVDGFPEIYPEGGRTPPSVHQIPPLQTVESERDRRDMAEAG